MFAVSQFTTMPHRAAEDLEAYAKAGVEAIELCEGKFPESERERRELVREMRANGLVVSSVQTAVHSIFPDRLAPQPASVAQRLEAFRRSLRFWAEVLETPDLPFVLIAGVVPGANLREGWMVAREWLRDAALAAAEVGVRIAFEPLGPEGMYRDSFIHGLDQGLRLLDEVESEATALVVDAWHVGGEHDLARRLTRAAGRVAVVHACDWPAEGPRALDDRVLPGDGILPLREKIFTPLRSGGYTGPFTVEVLSDTTLPDSLWSLPPAELLARAEVAMRRYQ
jgi:sugar phosphate isomerase/epimerase